MVDPLVFLYLSLVSASRSLQRPFQLGYWKSPVGGVHGVRFEAFNGVPSTDSPKRPRDLRVPMQPFVRS